MASTSSTPNRQRRPATTIAGGGGGASNCATTSAGACAAVIPNPPGKRDWRSRGFSSRSAGCIALRCRWHRTPASTPNAGSDGDCQPALERRTVQITAVGGTSRLAPSFAGIMALVNQKYGPQGQADFVLYPARYTISCCLPRRNQRNQLRAMCLFASAVASTAIASTKAISASPTPNFGTATEGQIGTGTTAEYNAGAGYDLASGLGTVDANVLVTNWGNVKFASTTTTLTPSPPRLLTAPRLPSAAPSPLGLPRAMSP